MIYKTVELLMRFLGKKGLNLIAKILDYFLGDGHQVYHGVPKSEVSVIHLPSLYIAKKGSVV